MKILVYAPALPYLIKDDIKPIGGITVELYEWIKGFQKNTNQVGILTWENSLKYIDSKINIDFVEGFKLRENKSIGLKKKSFIKAITSIYKYKPDLIILEGTIDLLYFFSFISRLLNIKFVYRLASDKDSDERIKNNIKGINLFLHNLGLLNAQYISVQNKSQFEKLNKRFPKKKIFMLYNPIMLQHNLAPLDKMNRSYIAWAGNFRKEKNLKALYDTAVKCKDVKFKIGGMDTPEIDGETRIFIEHLKQLSNVEFVGYLKRTDVGNFYSKAYALLNTSYFEGFSNTFLEAWAVGTPVISTVHVNPDNIIRKYSIGLIAKDFNEIPKCVQELLDKSDEEYRKISGNCRRYVFEKHDAEKLAKEFIRVVFENTPQL